MCETGSPPPRDDHPGADGMWEIDSLGLVEPLARLDAGRDRNGLPTPRVVVPHRRPL
ncbi:hypothetical protein [Streptomyces sp. GbtcB7]|uniref:hypothetical protein n=1 Tax=Streptomyces sp. GbtcB7 TaxID=2824752 RepID=UPI001C309CB9|nr:hypothetical protein [Streptomyces sp. GbtcB7]